MSTTDQARDLIELGQFYLITQKYSAAIKELRAGLKLDLDRSHKAAGEHLARLTGKP